MGTRTPTFTLATATRSLTETLTASLSATLSATFSTTATATTSATDTYSASASDTSTATAVVRTSTNSATFTTSATATLSGTNTLPPTASDTISQSVELPPTLTDTQTSTETVTASTTRSFSRTLRTPTATATVNPGLGAAAGNDDDGVEAWMIAVIVVAALLLVLLVLFFLTRRRMSDAETMHDATTPEKNWAPAEAVVDGVPATDKSAPATGAPVRRLPGEGNPLEEISEAPPLPVRQESPSDVFSHPEMPVFASAAPQPQLQPQLQPQTHPHLLGSYAAGYSPGRGGPVVGGLPALPATAGRGEYAGPRTPALPQGVPVEVYGGRGTHVDVYGGPTSPSLMTNQGGRGYGGANPDHAPTFRHGFENLY